jgi:hypothetical protein
MVDIPSAEAVAGSALGLSVLKPSAELIGEKLRENLDGVIQKAAKRLGPNGLERPGAVPLKVLKAVRDAGMVCETELEAEYLGGVLASSRTEIARDDRAASLIALIGRLSTYQLRTHYVMYALAQRTLAGETVNLGISSERELAGAFFLPHDDWVAAMSLSATEDQAWDGISLHVINGLLREGLMEDRFAYGDPERLRQFVPMKAFSTQGFVFTIAPLGIELFTAAHGFSEQVATDAFLVDSDAYRTDGAVELGSGFARLFEPPYGSPEQSAS